MLSSVITALEPYVRAMNPDWVAASVAATLLVGFVMKAHEKKHIPSSCFTVFYLCQVYISTVLSRIPGRATGVVLKPFWSYVQWLQGKQIFLKYIFLNFWMLLPMGISLCFVCKRKKRVLEFGFAFSCFIEVSQLLMGRGLFEIDDIIHNTAGVAMGILLYTVAERLKNKYHRHRYER